MGAEYRAAACLIMKTGLITPQRIIALAAWGKRSLGTSVLRTQDEPLSRPGPNGKLLRGPSRRLRGLPTHPGSDGEWQILMRNFRTLRDVARSPAVEGASPTRKDTVWSRRRGAAWVGSAAALASPPPRPASVS